MPSLTTSGRRAEPSSGSTADALVETLRRDIADGRLLPGEPLRQEELALRFGISRIPVREALRALQAEGLVSYSANRGATVTIVSDIEIMEMLEVRIALECHALRLAVPLAADADLAAAHLALEEYDAAPNAEAWSRMNCRFHWSLYMPCECRRLLDAIERNYGQFNSAARRRISLQAGKDRPQREHYRLIELTEKGRADEAAALLETHIRDTQRTIRAHARTR